MVLDFFDVAGLERVAPVRKLVQKVSGGHFLARGKVLWHTERIPYGCGLWVTFGRSSIRG